MTIVKLYRDMSDQQRQLIERNGFGGLLNFAFSQVNPELCNWLVSCFDADNSELVFPGRGSIPITKSTVHKVLGIPMGGEIINCKLDSAVTALMKQQFRIEQGNQPKISHILDFLKGYKNANSKYLRLWTLLAAASLLVPTFSTKVSSRLYSAVTDATAIGNKNWCELVVRVLREKQKPGTKKHGFEPCLTLLMILYVDSLQTGFKKISDSGFRITVWTNKLIKKAIDADTKPDGTFGALQLKPEFCGQDSMFLGRPLLLDSFINNQVPESFGPQERLKAKSAVQKMCSAMSKLVTNFLRDFYQPPAATNNHAFAAEEEEELGEEEHLEEHEEEEHLEEHEEEFVDEEEEELEEREEELVDETKSEASSNDELGRDSVYPDESDKEAEEGSEEEHVQEKVGEAGGKDSGEEDGDTDGQHYISNQDHPSQVQGRTDKDTDLNPPQPILLGNAAAALLSLSDLYDGDEDNDEPFLGKQAEAHCKDEATEDGHNGQASFGSVIILPGPLQATHPAKSNTDNVDSDYGQDQGKGDDVLKLHETNEAQGLNDVSDEALGSDQARGAGGAVSTSDVSQSFKPMHIDTTFIDKVSIQDYESDLARDRKIPKVQTNNADGTSRSATSYMDNDPQEPAPLEVEYPAQDLARVLSFKCTAPTNVQEVAASQGKAQSAHTGTINSLQPLDFDPPSFDLGISDMSSQEKASQEPVAAGNKDVKLAKRSLVWRRRRLQLPRAAQSDDTIGIQETSAQIAAAATNIAGELHAGSEGDEATGDNKPAPIFVGSESQEDGLQQDHPIVIQSQGQGQQTQEDGLQQDDPILVQSQSQVDLTQQDGSEQGNPILVLSQSQGDQTQSFITPADSYIPDVYIPDEVLLELDALIPAKQDNGITPVPHVRYERVTKPGPTKRSPYINYSQKLSYELSKSDKEAYTKIIRFGHGNRSKKNLLLIVNYGSVHTTLGDFADSFKPKGQLSNQTADCILHILKDQLKAKSKCVLSHRIATFAMAGDLQRTEMKSSFSFDKRLDHYNLLFFPVLEVNLTTELKHWFVIVLNFKAQRFELMDSLRGEQDKNLWATSNNIISNIKILWKQHHAKSKIDISHFKSLYIDAPKQESTVDCGFYMLKYIEYWDGKTVPQINQSDMYNIRVNYMSKMLHWKGNLVTWHQVVK
ncbi:unnamed protein product [Urochloa decumbens]|uniref:Ubiquitin-like protease family profile domain-containing protein n=1 Tax=Urochloa decumbens TaxID=240449 RepID=A0ABC9D8M6_9POAL